MTKKGFSLKKESNYSYLPKEGIYRAEIESFEILKNPTYDRFEKKSYPAAVFVFKLPNGKKINNWFLLKLIEFSLIDKLIKAALGETEEEIDLSDLIGEEVLIDLKHEPGKDGTGMYARIKNILPIEDAEQDLDEENSEEDDPEEEDSDEEDSDEEDSDEDDSDDDSYSYTSSKQSINNRPLSFNRKKRNMA